MKEIERRYVEWRGRLLSDVPKFVSAYTEIMAAMPTGALSLDSIWARLWDKPLWAHIDERIGRRNKDYLESVGFAESFRKEPERWRVAFRQGARRWNAVDAAELVGDLAHQHFGQAARVRGEPAIALHRLAAICSLSRALSNAEVVPSSVFQEVCARDATQGMAEAGTLSRWLRGAQSELGVGWGPITVLHGFTDLGFACKPDIHVSRSLRELGALKKDVNAQSLARFVAGGGYWDCVDACMSLSARIDPLPSSGRWVMREVDIVLFWASKAALFSTAPTAEG